MSKKQVDPRDDKTGLHYDRKPRKVMALCENPRCNHPVTLPGHYCPHCATLIALNGGVDHDA